MGKIHGVQHVWRCLQNVYVLEPHKLKLDVDLKLLELYSMLSSPTVSSITGLSRVSKLQQGLAQHLTHSSAGCMSCFLSAAKISCISTKHSRYIGLKSTLPS